MRECIYQPFSLLTKKKCMLRLLNHVPFQSRFFFINHVYKYFYILNDWCYLNDSSITCIGERFRTECHQVRLPFFSFTYSDQNEVFIRRVAAANVYSESLLWTINEKRRLSGRCSLRKVTQASRTPCNAGLIYPNVWQNIDKATYFNRWCI